MLNYNLVQLVGPKHRDLKVKSPEKYSFKPRQLLSDILDIYIHLCPPNRNEFVAAVARDGRSYSAQHFKKAIEILTNHRIKRPDEIDKLSGLVSRFESVLAQDKIEEEELGEVPEWCLDPLMFTIMEDPVILPSSKQIVDRSTITSHLLSDATDPFNRAPLTIDMVTEGTMYTVYKFNTVIIKINNLAPEIKQRIEEWRKSRKHGRN
jgi:ubiquitin conjugation factor E4 B